MTAPRHSAEDDARAPRCSRRTGQDCRSVTEGDGKDRHSPANATKVSRSKRISARTETNHPGERNGAGKRATVAAMPGTPAPIAQTVTVSAHAAARYRHRIKPGVDRHAAGGELERLRAMGEVSAQEPALLGAATPAPYYLLIGDAIVLPLPPQAHGWVATTCVTRRTLTATPRKAKSARRASLGACKRAHRRARS